MNFNIKRLPDHSVIVSTALASWNASLEWEPFYNALTAALDDEDGQVIYIADLRLWQPDLGELMITANKATRDGRALLKHPHVAEFVVVTEKKIVQMAANGLNSEVFGNVAAATFEDLDTAVAYAKSKAASLG